jgi:class 3 adenylate cyclase
MAEYFKSRENKMSTLKLYDAVMQPETNIDGTILVVDISNSTIMKEEQAEVAWLGNYAKLFDGVLSCVPESGQIVKYLGDGIMIFFGEDRQTDAVNTAIRMQESIDYLIDKNIINCTCSIGIASGSFKKIPIEDDRFDYLGQVVDRAFRLCSAAMPKAIFADADTIVAANATRIHSEVGKAMKWTAREYVGNIASLQLKGFNRLVEFHEIGWARDRYGVKPNHTTKPNPSPKFDMPSKEISSTSVIDQKRGTGTVFGRFSGWHEKDGKISGFINGEDNNDYFCHRGSLCDGVELKTGDEVFFVPSKTDKRLELASGVFPVSSKFDTVVVNKSGQNIFLESEILERFGHGNIFFFATSELESKINVGDKLQVKVIKGFNKKLQKTSMKAEIL